MPKLRPRQVMLVGWILGIFVASLAATIATRSPDESRRFIAVLGLIASNSLTLTLFLLWRFGPRLLAHKTTYSPNETKSLMERLDRSAGKYPDLWNVIYKALVPVVVALIGVLGIVLASGE